MIISDRPVLVLAHYFGGAARSWHPLLAALGGTFECVVPDLPGFSGTAPLSGAPTLDGYADGFAALAPPRPWIAVGHSMGGKIALATALGRPPELRALILIATSPPTPEPLSDEDRRKALSAFGSREKAKAHFNAITNGTLQPALFAACVEDELAVDRGVWNWWLQKGSRADISAATATLSLPMLVLAGDQDTVMGPETAPAVACGLADATLKLIPGAGHLAPLERPAAVAEAIQDFVTSGIDR